jgi:rhodanese-related sulfurtransferase/DNA-binding transcriptional ArsR family regulator
VAHDRAIKEQLNQQFARIGKCLAAPRRVELLDLLAQGERNVEGLAVETQMSIGLTSAHLQSLRRAGLVETRRHGTRILYRLAGGDVYRLLASVRSVAHARLVDVQVIVDTHMRQADGLEPISRHDLLARVRDGTVTVVDVRPRDEYDAGHIPEALSIPIDELEARLAELPRDADIVAYCRGPFCMYAPTAVATLRSRGFRAWRLQDGFPEWRLAGLPISTGFALPAMA